jgi:CheY-like chemotaxis protein/serine phosphatase RsbU (regulator of sigma subunit)
MKIEELTFTEMEILSHTILLVDDSPVNLGVVVENLERHGFEVSVALDGDEALQRVELVKPDVILLDVMMPGIDGFEVCRRLKSQPHTRDIPVIFMTSLGGTEDKVAGFRCGAVDYVTKPLQIEEVRARVNTHLSLHDLKRRLAEKIAVQEHNLERLAHEDRVAARYMNKLIALDTLEDPSVLFHLQPAANFSGDLIAFARTPDGRLHLMLADSTGHGLSAALAAMPVIEPFYAMTGKGFGLSAIAREINSKVNHTLPVSHFVGVILASIDADAQMVEVWSGGCPPPLVLNGAGEPVYRFKARHLAMGILPPEQFDDSVEYFSYDAGEHSLLMFSDGVIELENAAGERFGLSRLLSAANVAEPAARWSGITGALAEYCGVRTFNHDDIALMTARCELRGLVTELDGAQKKLERGQGTGKIGWQFALTLEMEQLRQLDVVPLLLDIVQQVEKGQGQDSQIFLILSEMFCNALEHGLLKLDSSLKQQEDGIEKYFEERALRLAATEGGQIHLHLKKIRNSDGSTSLRIRMKDSGDGFDYHNWPTRLAEGTLRYGRGIPLLCSVCRSVQYLGNGSEVVVEFDCSSGKS